VDLINNDANRILNSFHEIIFGLVAPFQIIIITIILYIYISYFAFVAIGSLFILVAPNAIIAKKMHLSRKRMLHHTDERLRSVAELVQVSEKEEYCCFCCTEYLLL
jgi:ABC-type bacteriocin/lantibiotic exporter with double-glycine peptidase domain